MKFKNFFFLSCLLPLFTYAAQDYPENGSSAPEVSLEDYVSPFPLGYSIPPTQPDGWIALPQGRPFPTLAPDPRDLKIALRKNNKGELEADIGGYRSLAGWKGSIKNKTTILHTGIEGTAYFLLRQEGSKFPLHSSDGVIGLYGEAIRGLWMYQLRFTHLSAHLSDGITAIRQRFSYTRETLSLRFARQLDSFRVYTGLHYLVHTKPVLPRASLQLGFFYVSKFSWKKIHPYAGADLKIRSSQEGTNLHAIAGLAIHSDVGAPLVRFGLNYTKGHDLRGQFYFEKTEKWSLGLDMDL
ncbi:MAG: DUF1207 domain-containing protein [Oligoflexia bacterium]|nr:DUF1207 domain-containing protein [Oligoflexia bacterium]